MDCRKARRLIPLAADGQLDEPTLVRLHGHLASCDSCARLLESDRSAIRSIEEALQAAARCVTAPRGFARYVAARAAAERRLGRPRLFPVSRPAARIWAVLSSSRRAAAAAACAVILAAAILTGIVIGRALDSSPVASTQMYSGHLIAFTVNPRPDGRVFAGVNAHRYCRVIRAREEGLR